jgi:hypothetical protein
MEYALSWRTKRRLIPGGRDRVRLEIAVTPLQISLIADPGASIRDAIEALRGRRNGKARRSDESDRP